MTDAHCHDLGEAEGHFLCSPSSATRLSRWADGGEGCDPSLPSTVRLFVGFHPWEAGAFDEAALCRALESDETLGVGEIGLDRLRSREISEPMRRAFERQLALAAEFRRPVALHGAKCWGEVVRACKPYAGRIGAFLFHGFSRSAGLLGDIEAMNGFISAGPAVLNDHAVNYRRMLANVPERMLLVESDREEGGAPPPLRAIVAALAGLRSVSYEQMVAALNANVARFLGAFPS